MSHSHSGPWSSFRLGQLRADLPTAMLAVNVSRDRRRTGFRERAFVLPRDMGLVCFCDVEHLAVLSPFPTVIERPAETFGTLGTQMPRAGLFWCAIRSNTDQVSARTAEMCVIHNSIKIDSAIQSTPHSLP